MFLDGTSLRSDVARLQRATGMSLAPPTIEDVLKGEMDDTSAAAKLQGALFLKEIEGWPVPSHTEMHYPCYVMALSKLQTLERLPKHEDALQSEQLDELMARSVRPSCAYR